MTTQKRLRDPAVDDEGFTLVSGRKRARARRSTPLELTHTEQRGPLPVWRLVSHELPNSFQAVKWIEKELKVDLKVTIPRSGEFHLRATTWDSATTLEEIARGQPQGIVLRIKERTMKAVIHGYPVALPLDPLKEHPNVAEAERCTYNAGHGRFLPTRQVKVTLRGFVPASLNLGCWGRFPCRPFTPEPVRCFRCHGYGHHQRQCRRQKELCGVCSEDHATKDCIRRLREGGPRPVALCPNCGAGHHAWNRRCPERLRRIPGRKPGPPPAPPPRQEEKPPPPRERTPSAAPSAPKPASRRTRRRRTRKRGRTRDDRKDAPPPPPSQAMEASSSRTTKEKETAEPATCPVAVERPPTKEAPRQHQATQTTQLYTYTEGEMVNLLVVYEHLVEQEAQARCERIPHEPALQFARRLLRAGDPPATDLITARPLSKKPYFYDHVGEQNWVAYSDEDDQPTMDLDTDALLLDESRDLTEEEFARLLE